MLVVLVIHFDGGETIIQLLTIEALVIISILRSISHHVQ